MSETVSVRPLVQGCRDARELTVGRLLQFSPKAEEAKYQKETSYRRLRSRHRVDAALFFALAMFMATGWKRVYNAGHANEMPYMLLSGILYSCCTLMYAVRGSPGGLLEFLQQRMRVKIHIMVYILAITLFSRHIGLPNMGACSPFVPSFSAFEALVVYLMWAAAYPMMAGIPLRYSIFLQILSFWIMDRESTKQCMMGDICLETDRMYALYARSTDIGASVIPLLGPDGIKDTTMEEKMFTCRTMMCFTKLFVVVGLSVYMTYSFEINSRMDYILNKGNDEKTAGRLMSKRSDLWQHCIEILLMGAMFWQVVVVCIDPLRGEAFPRAMKTY